MADEIKRSLVIDTGNSVETLGKLRREMASIVTQLEDVEEGSEAFVKLQSELKKTEAEVSKVEGAFGDATDKIKTLSGSGVERFNASVGLMKEGIRNLDLGKFKIGIQGATQAFGGLGKAIFATGIGALVLAVVAIIKNFDELKKAGGLVGKVFTAIGDIVNGLIQGLKDLSDLFGLTNIAASEAAEAEKKYAESINETNRQIGEQRRQQLVLTGKLSEEEAARQNAKEKFVTDFLKIQAEAREKILEESTQAGKKKVEEERQLKIKALQETYVTEILTINKGEKDKNAAKAKADADAKKSAADKEKKRREEEDKARLDALAKEASDDLDAKERGKIAEAKFLADMKALNEQAGNELAALADAELNDLALRNEQKLSAEKAYTDMVKEEEEKRVKARKDAIDRGFEIANAGLNALSSLNDLFTTLETNRLKKGEKASIDLQKKQFRRGKALAVAQTGINTAQAIVRALADPGGIPGVVLSVAAGITGAAQIAAILAKKFNPETGDTGGGDTGSTSTPSLGGAGQSSFIAPPTFSLGGQQIGGAGTLLGSGFGQNQQQPIKVFVSETDISAVQNKVQVTQGNSLFEGPQ